MTGCSVDGCSLQHAGRGYCNKHLQRFYRLGSAFAPVKKLNNGLSEIERFNFKCQNFENIELEKNNLLVANFSIPFCNRNYFNDFWNKISNSILEERIFCW